MKKTIVLSSILILFNTALVLAQTTVKHAQISFKIKNMGIGTGGTIGGLQASVKFNPADLTASTLDASVEVNTINTDNSMRDEHLRGEDFFDLAHYPKITIKSVSFKHKSGNNYSGIFDLTIKGKTKQVEVPFTYTDKGNTIILNGTFKLNRLDFGVGGSSLVMGNEVSVTVDAEMER
ncbi:polyisoprenoid-binding protein YceI [Mucilaginibacter frigoritolerans]|jgi:polyisoprenoid-binding protein YceI|uniref:Polyisoprenoid-binding protein YceI n=1 Tax=Mucilaginibacter frigoritolerans TaxID=652788 RepID=A0A562U0T8_9SPHI|nr:YceI family protein [Mucilaginibacter frigoritolerans]TWI99397.1 polyisoprenoid-binding protein YceI [Mucilaginibacter frigoritolerans]